MELNFAQFLNEAPLATPAALPPAPGGMGGAPPPPGGAMGGGMPPPPMGGGMGMPPPPMGGGMGGPMPGQPQQQGPKELKQTDVWGVLEELLGITDKKQDKAHKKTKHSNDHLMS